MVRSIKTLGDAEDALRELDNAINVIKHSIIPPVKPIKVVSNSNRFPTLNVTITLAALTGGGTQGSITVRNGIITSFVPST